MSKECNCLACRAQRMVDGAAVPEEHRSFLLAMVFDRFIERINKEVPEMYIDLLNHSIRDLPAYLQNMPEKVRQQYVEAYKLKLQLGLTGNLSAMTSVLDDSPAHGRTVH